MIARLVFALVLAHAKHAAAMFDSNTHTLAGPNAKCDKGRPCGTRLPKEICLASRCCWEPLRSSCFYPVSAPTPAPSALADNADWRACVETNGTACQYCDGRSTGPKTCLYVIDRNLVGPIPPADLARLTGLTALALRGNALTGPIPGEIGRLTNLQHLDMRYSGEHSMGGQIPSEMGKLTNLAWLSLAGNAFTGAAPGFCAIVQNELLPCDLLPNKEWTDGALCPLCMNTGKCKPPVNCTGPN